MEVREHYALGMNITISKFFGLLDEFVVIS
jgi:hypothetical protein